MASVCALVPDLVRWAYLRVTSRLAPVPLAILASLITVTCAAWALTLYQTATMSAPSDALMGGGMANDSMQGMAMEAMAMDGMSAGGWSFAGLAIFVAVWTVMMIAMMLPAAMPMIAVFASAQARRDRQVAVPTWIFVAGYILVWAAAGLLVYVLVRAVSKWGNGISLDRDIWRPLVLGATLAIAGMYQFTALKRICLRHCRSPFGFVAQYWRNGRAGALAMGIQHGLYCLGCCWALFAVLVAAGMMSIAWMLLLTLVTFAEKVLPHGERTSAAVGLGLIALGLIVAGAGVRLPGHA
jgi:predicted metal-binding membrane protein